MNCIRKYLLIVSCLLALLLPFVAHGQTTTAITGVVMDSTGAVIGKAKVTAHNQQTGQDLTTVSTSTGNYTFPALRPGVYNISATAAGFDTASVADIRLHLDSVATANLTLRPGVAQEVVTVHADEELLDVTHASRGETFTQDELETAPLNSGNPLMLANSEPAVTFQGTNVGVQPGSALSITIPSTSFRSMAASPIPTISSSTVRRTIRSNSETAISVTSHRLPAYRK